MVGRYIEPMTDFGFKKIFAEPENSDILIDLLNTLLGYSGDEMIKDIQYLSPEIMGKSENDRRVYFDLYCQSQKGEYFIVEMQRTLQTNYVDRAFFYSTRSFEQQSRKGEWRYKLAPVCSINLLGFNLSQTPGQRPLTDDKYFYSYRLVEDNDPTDILSLYRIVFVELGALNKSPDKHSSRLEKWVYAMKHIAEWHEKPESYREDSIFDRFFQKSEVAQYSYEERLLYEGSLRNLRDEYNILQTKLEMEHEKGW